jgi:hypothetical protein
LAEANVEGGTQERDQECRRHDDRTAAAMACRGRRFGRSSCAQKPPLDLYPCCRGFLRPDQPTRAVALQLLQLIADDRDLGCLADRMGRSA